MSVPPLGGSLALQQWAQGIALRVNVLENTGAIAPNAVQEFLVSPAAQTDGAQIIFELTSTQGIASVLLLRGFTQDAATATLLASYSAGNVGTSRPVTYSDADPALAGRTAYYWLELVPANATLRPTLIGPQSLAAAAGDRVPPDSLIDFDASESVATGNIVTIGASFQPPNETRFGSCKIYATGYQGNPKAVAVAQAQSDPMSFTLEATGETVTLKAVSVNRAGIEADLGTALTKVLTLNGVATVPAKVMGVTATATAAAVQVAFPAGPEPSITQYVISRAPLGGGSTEAVQIGTVAPTMAAAYTFEDSTGLGGQYEWYVQAQNSAGKSSYSAAATTVAVTSSANLPANVPANNTNYATVDSIDAGSSATVRIYGAGGVGTSWTRQAGFGQQTYPPGTLAGLNYDSDYYVVWNGAAYIAQPGFAGALADSLIWAGKVHTVKSGGTGGVDGGGGPDGNFMGGRLYTG